MTWGHTLGLTCTEHEVTSDELLWEATRGTAICTEDLGGGDLVRLNCPGSGGYSASLFSPLHRLNEGHVILPILPSDLVTDLVVRQ